MHRADSILHDVYAKANALDRYKCTFYPGPHKFDRPMQAEAFDWFDALVESLRAIFQFDAGSFNR